ncbi:MAG TPA: multifunctional CCA tRNA nucleotidyl transferase/2'3'-cyclic phosphodiesterase/2'nucleotidase/phosphatase [Burkholderiaceae bacterium]|nr:multifunctional CCA tRNA nucleotidyl transferase/2'3'-cyclic phosphodiesterase/2'nucleotidase/phosphatase [Burkholderiaceae bacterium]
MKAYVVGGAVRDRLLGCAVNDRDWVVVGATPEQMLAAGYTPVGRDFPVFLHPTTHEQYALARTERKSGRGYHGFQIHAAPDVTLQQDLARRDLTINAIAEDADSGELIDPFGGQRDLHDGVLRHVSDAFAEDPVRLLRLARFAARWPHFTVADSTRALLRRLVDDGEVDALVPERVWQEVSRGLDESRPSRMFDVLLECGALQRLAPMLQPCFADPPRRAMLMQAIDHAPASIAVRWACLCHAIDATPAGVAPDLPQLRALCERWRVDVDSRDLAVMVAREWPLMTAGSTFDPVQCLGLLERCDAWRRPERLQVALAAFDALGRATPAASTSVQRRCEQVRLALQSAQRVSAAALPEALRHAGGPALGQALRDARLQAISEAFDRT